MSDSIEVREEVGFVLAEDAGGRESHRWWFQETEEGRLMLTSEVVEDGERRYKSEREADVPSRVLSALAERGFDGDVVDTSGVGYDR